ncbi:MAG: hypothetical protein H0V86_04945 [Chloroflexia bacterium]|nr:hypothetical protein [Chloroflexia bacterium]
MKRRNPVRWLAAPGVLLLAVASVGRAEAHGFGQRYTLPVPLWLYLYGSAAVVVLSFVLVGFFVGEEKVPGGYRRYNLLGVHWLRTLLPHPALLLTLRLLSVGLFALVVISGTLGDQAPSLNFAPTFVWVIWWVGLGAVTALVGNLWVLLNPWKTLFDWADAAARRMALGGLELHAPYPRWLGVWPALLLYFGFVWLEIIFAGAPRPSNIALFALAYSVITWTGMVYFGRDVWLRQGEAFSVFFGILARFAPTEVRVTDSGACTAGDAPCHIEPDGCVNCYECFEFAEPAKRELNLRPWAVGLVRGEAITADRLAFVLFMLASVTVDGLQVTSAWLHVEALAFPATQAVGRWGYPMLQTLGLLVVPVLFGVIYYGFAELMRRASGREQRVHTIAAGFIYSLVPIALAYQIAHYYTLLLIQGQSIIPLLSDPFGWGWNLFGTAGYSVNAAVLGAAFVWYSQVALIVAGHVIAVYLAHVLALRLLRNPRRALHSQYPLLALMVLYTVSSLWILSQPIIEETNRAGLLLYLR